MIHLYNLGFNGRYIAYPDCEFQEGITRTFDEEAGRHRKFALGAHELVFNSFQDMMGKKIYWNGTANDTTLSMYCILLQPAACLSCHSPSYIHFLILNLI